MSDPDPTFDSPGDRELGEALAALVPVASRLDAVSAAFEAGQRSGETSRRSQVRRWQATAAVLAGGWAVLAGWAIPSHNDSRPLSAGQATAQATTPARASDDARLPPARPADDVVPPAIASVVDVPLRGQSLWAMQQRALSGDLDGPPAPATPREPSPRLRATPSLGTRFLP
jgi:hypothetical protein